MRLSYVVRRGARGAAVTPMSPRSRTSDPDTIRNQLVEQVTGMVRWRESVANMAAAGVEEFVELGGKVLGPDGQAHRAGREGDERGHDRGHRSAGEGDRMMFDLTGMTALVTGASGGLGSAIAKALGGAGRAAGGVGQQCREARGLPRGRSAAIMSRCRATCRTARRSTSWSRRRSRRSAASSTSSSTMPASPATISLMRMKDEEFEEVIRINLEAAFRLMRAAAKPMMKARFGRIISVTSVVGVTGNPGQANYVASKAGLIGMTKAVAQELASRGITVNAVAPGFMTSAMTDALNDQQREAILSRIPMGAMGSGEDIGAAVRLSGEPRGRLRHRPDAARERRDGDALSRARRIAIAATIRGTVSPSGTSVNSPTCRATSGANQANNIRLLSQGKYPFARPSAQSHASAGNRTTKS